VLSPCHVCRWADKLRNEDLYLFDLNHFHLLWDAEQAGDVSNVALNPRVQPLQGELRKKHLVIDAARQVKAAHCSRSSQD
jgi:hypothetical protein